MEENKDVKMIEDRRKHGAVINGQAKLKKKSGLAKFKGMLINEDSKEVKSYLLTDVFIPGIKKIISEIISGGVDMLLYGEVRRKDRGGNRIPVSNVSYRQYYDDGRSNRGYERRPRYEAFDYDNLEFDNRGDAELVLNALDDCIDQYGMATVAEAYDLAGITNTSYMANKYGWTSLSSAQIVRDGSKYYIDFPKAMPID